MYVLLDNKTKYIVIFNLIINKMYIIMFNHRFLLDYPLDYTYSYTWIIFIIN